MFNTSLSSLTLLSLPPLSRLISDHLPVSPHDHKRVVAEVKQYAECGPEPESNDPPLELEHCEQREGDPDEPVADHSPDGGHALLAQAANDPLAYALDAVDEDIAEHDRVGRGNDRQN